MLILMTMKDVLSFSNDAEVALKMFTMENTL